ncbi:hypothetical protein GCM10009841_35530 [Microlunatus panaciterrae]
MGVGCLYWVPEIASSPHQLGGAPAPDPHPTSKATVTVTTRNPTRPPSRPTAARTALTHSDAAPPQQTRRGTTTQQPSITPTRQRRSSDDRSRPERLSGLALLRADHDTLTVSWAAGTDNVGVVAYRVLLNGYLQRTTTALQATLNWFNSDDAQIVQIQAVDRAGNESPVSAALLVRRPAAGSTESPEPTPTPSPSSPAPTPTGTPSQAPTPGPSDASPTPSDSPSPSVTPAASGIGSVPADGGASQQPLAPGTGDRAITTPDPELTQ